MAIKDKAATRNYKSNSRKTGKANKKDSSNKHSKNYKKKYNGQG